MYNTSYIRIGLLNSKFVFRLLFIIYHPEISDLKSQKPDFTDNQGFIIDHIIIPFYIYLKEGKIARKSGLPTARGNVFIFLQASHCKYQMVVQLGQGL